MALTFKTYENVEGWGRATKLVLTTVSEDGRQTEFTGTFLQEDDADKLAAFWQTSAENRRIIHLAASLTRPSFDD